MPVRDCPFCEPEDKLANGCCFCDHNYGNIRIGPGNFFETIEDYESMVAARKEYLQSQQVLAVDYIKKIREKLNQ